MYLLTVALTDLGFPDSTEGLARDGNQCIEQHDNVDNGGKEE